MNCGCRGLAECNHDLLGLRQPMTDEEFHPRAMKLIRKRKNFLVVAEDEPYFMDVYSMIRQHEFDISRWSSEDEIAFLAAQQCPARPNGGHLK